MRTLSMIDGEEFCIPPLSFFAQNFNLSQKATKNIKQHTLAVSKTPTESKQKFKIFTENLRIRLKKQ